MPPKRRTSSRKGSSSREDSQKYETTSKDSMPPTAASSGRRGSRPSTRQPQRDKRQGSRSSSAKGGRNGDMDETSGIARSSGAAVARSSSQALARSSKSDTSVATTAGSHGRRLPRRLSEIETSTSRTSVGGRSIEDEYSGHRPIQVTVRITQTRPPVQTVPTSTGSSGETSVKRVMASVNVYSGSGQPQRRHEEPGKAPKKPSISREHDNDLDGSVPVDLKQFLPGSTEALQYTELLEYPKSRSPSPPASPRSPKPIEEVKRTRRLSSVVPAAPKKAIAVRPLKGAYHADAVAQPEPQPISPPEDPEPPPRPQRKASDPEPPPRPQRKASIPADREPPPRPQRKASIPADPESPPKLPQKATILASQSAKRRLEKGTRPFKGTMRDFTITTRPVITVKQPAHPRKATGRKASSTTPFAVCVQATPVDAFSTDSHKMKSGSTRPPSKSKLSSRRRSVSKVSGRRPSSSELASRRPSASKVATAPRAKPDDTPVQDTPADSLATDSHKIKSGSTRRPSTSKLSSRRPSNSKVSGRGPATSEVASRRTSASKVAAAPHAKPDATPVTKSRGSQGVKKGRSGHSQKTDEPLSSLASDKKTGEATSPLTSGDRLLLVSVSPQFSGETTFTGKGSVRSPPTSTQEATRSPDLASTREKAAFSEPTFSEPTEKNKSVPHKEETENVVSKASAKTPTKTPVNPASEGSNSKRLEVENVEKKVTESKLGKGAKTQKKAGSTKSTSAKKPAKDATPRHGKAPKPK